MRNLESTNVYTSRSTERPYTYQSYKIVLVRNSRQPSFDDTSKNTFKFALGDKKLAVDRGCRYLDRA